MKPFGARRALLENCALREAAPGAQPAELAADEPGWLRIDRPMPVAAALRACGQWSLDGPARAFDAQDWWYRLRFDSPPAATGERTVLGFDGLATLATGWLNGEPLLESANMFTPHECDVSDALRPRGNELLLRFRALDAHLAQRRPRPRWRVPMLVQQQLRWVRTTLLGRTPGWSPPAAVVGPWRDIWLEQRGASHLGPVDLTSAVAGSTGIVRCTVALEPAAAGACETIELQLQRAGRSHVHRLQRKAPGLFAGELYIPDADLWWPHTHGQPALYAASLRSVSVRGVAIEMPAGNVGFRTIELHTAGGEFRVEVNGVPVFCRGACWMPLDAVSLRSSPGPTRHAVAQARAAGMNMLRVPGTTVYEDDHFYEACDEQGVLVWQDFMFANMDYPADDEAFMASVEQEVQAQLRRLRAHPSLGVLCGNSEVAQQAAMWGAPRDQWRSPLFDHRLPELCAVHAPGTPYWPSSAHGGSFPFEADAGTSSYYGVGAYLRPLDDARRSGLRFATECLAFANVPSDSALARMPGGQATRAHHPQWKLRSPRDLAAGWDFDDVRDHYLRALFGVDPHQLRHADHSRYLALGRLVTGEAMAAAFSEWRRPDSSCGGALVLMLRDLWAGAGWGVVDGAGAPKACYHALKRVLQPVTVLLTDEGGNGLHIHAINERDQAQPVSLELAAWQHGEFEVASGRQALALPARGAITLPAVELLDHFMDLGYAYRFGPPPCDTVAVTLKSHDGQPLAQAFHFPAGWPVAQEAALGLEATARALADGTTELVVAARRLAFGVHFDLPGFEADDEHFHLAPGSCRRVLLRGPAGRRPKGEVLAANARRGQAVSFLE